MKIAHLVSTFPPYFGGMGNAVFAMAQESARQGHEVTVLTPRGRRSPLNPSHPPFSEREED
ncbi:glycogen/starch synthase, partial [Candidatus Uhrbacteria bacterium]|nr:glycogen/starch synthase [Candidatus Uhrbacteria bacterium]